jgi:hypothetical protein
LNPEVAQEQEQCWITSLLNKKIQIKLFYHFGKAKESFEKKKNFFLLHFIFIFLSLSCQMRVRGVTMMIRPNSSSVACTVKLFTAVLYGFS